MASLDPVLLPLAGIVNVNESVVVKSDESVKTPLTVALLPRVTVDALLLIVRLLYPFVLVTV